mgnify:CR=1 FL=1
MALDISIFEDKTGVYPSMVFEVNEETHKVPMTTFNRCCKELNIKSTQGAIALFEDICDWFIKENQYVEFEECESISQ